MNRKNTILIAVLINAGLLIVLFVAALTTGDPVAQTHAHLVDSPITLPKFDDIPQMQELPQLEKSEESIVHSLPPLAPEIKSEPLLEPAPIEAAISQKEVIVKKGDSLEKIAKVNKTNVAEILKLNHLSNTVLRVGQVLKIPTPSLEMKESSPEYYTIKVGESPWAIASKHRMKVHELLKLNGLNEEKARKLKPGDRLRIR